MPWSIVTKYLVHKSWHLLETKGDLEMSDKFIGHWISDETKNLVSGFHEDDENSIVALKLKRLKYIFVKIELSLDSSSHHHSSGLKSLKSLKIIF